MMLPYILTLMIGAVFGALGVMTYATIERRASHRRGAELYKRDIVDTMERRAIERIHREGRAYKRPVGAACAVAPIAGHGGGSTLTYDYAGYAGGGGSTDHGYGGCSGGGGGGDAGGGCD